MSQNGDEKMRLEYRKQGTLYCKIEPVYKTNMYDQIREKYDNHK